MPGEFIRSQFRDGRESDPRIAVDAVFEGHNQPVVQNAVDENWPTGQRSVTEAQVSVYEPQEFMKNDMNNDCVRIPAIDSRRENQIEAKTAKFLVIPAQRLIGKIPQQEIKQRRARQGGNPMPDRFSGSGGRRGGSAKANNVEVPDRLRIDMYLAGGLPKKILNLLNNAPLGAVLAVQERGNDGDAQFKPARARARSSWWQPAPPLVAQYLAAGKVCPIIAKDMHS